MWTLRSKHSRSKHSRSPWHTRSDTHLLITRPSALTVSRPSFRICVLILLKGTYHHLSTGGTTPNTHPEHNTEWQLVWQPLHVRRGGRGSLYRLLLEICQIDPLDVWSNIHARQTGQSFSHPLSEQTSRLRPRDRILIS